MNDILKKTKPSILLKYAEADDGASFYIQCKGLHSGQPLKKRIPNCFAVFTDDDLAFEKCFCIWKSKSYYILIRGSVVPFISIRETRKLLHKSFLKMADADKKKILAIQQIDSAIALAEERIKLFKNMQFALASEIFK